MIKEAKEMPSAMYEKILPLLTQDERKKALMLRVYVVPGARQEEVIGCVKDVDGKDCLKIKLRAIAEGGKANEALCRLISKILKVACSRCSIVRGHLSRHKTIEIRATIDEIQESRPKKNQ